MVTKNIKTHSSNKIWNDAAILLLLNAPFAHFGVAAL